MGCHAPRSASIEIVRPYQGHLSSTKFAGHTVAELPAIALILMARR
jgi:hypothetical protein